MRTIIRYLLLIVSLAAFVFALYGVLFPWRNGLSWGDFFLPGASSQDF
jgi:hypothetical protein